MIVRPAAAERPRFDIGDIVRQHRAALESQVGLTLSQRRVLSAIALCRTAALGGHIDVCRSCGYEHPAYNSCRNRHCPKCQALAQEKWIAARSEQLLPVKHFHVVFTMPSQLRPMARYHSRELYNALFASASATLNELGRTRLGARIGMTMVLHTWTRDLRYHPHVHAIVTAGGLGADDSHWIPSSPKYLFPVKVMGALFRGKMMAQLRALHEANSLQPLSSPEEPADFERLMATLASKSWVVFAKKPFREARHVMAYLGRYTHRVAIANSRLVDVSDDTVTFRTKNGKTVSVTPVEFLRRFTKHVLPDGFHKIRHYGLYGSAQRGGRLETSRQILDQDETTPRPDDGAQDGAQDEWEQLLQSLTGRDVSRCPVCGTQLERFIVHSTGPVSVGTSNSRAPPPTPSPLRSSQ